MFGEQRILNGVSQTPLLYKPFFITFISILFFTQILVILVPAEFTALQGAIISTNSIKLAKIILLFLAMAFL